MTNLYDASKQWLNRPSDERFASLAEMLDFCEREREDSRQEFCNYSDLKLFDEAGEITVNGIKTTHWSFGQVCSIMGAPAGFMRRLPAPLVCTVLNNLSTGLDGRGKVLVRKRGDERFLRAVTSDTYARIWNEEVVRRLMSLEEIGWRVPPARPAFANQPGTRIATEADVLRASNFGLSIRPGDLIAPAGLYASAHDMFAFMINEDKRIDDGSDGGLSRGFFVENSEVGASALNLTMFYYRHVCGNHIVWGASKVTKVRIVHRGRAIDRFSDDFMREMAKFADSSTAEDEAKILRAREKELGDSREAVVDMLYGLKLLPRKDLLAAYDVAEREEDTVSPRSVWGMVQGITRLSQDTPFADQRAAMDRAAGKVLALAG